jgi:hypothetical protein
MPGFPTVSLPLRLAANKFPVSFCVEFPAGREKRREFLRFRRFLRKSVSKTSAHSAICRRIPYAGEQGIISREQGIDFPEQGFRALAPTRLLRQKPSSPWIRN